MDYKIISFKNYKGGGIGFLKSTYSLKDLEEELLFASTNAKKYNYNCRFGKKYSEDFTDKCETCFWCRLNHDIEEFTVIGTVRDADLNTKELINFQDKFYWNGGDCC